MEITSVVALESHPASILVLHSHTMKLLFPLACSIGCMTQVILLVMQYMMYDISTSVAFIHPKIITLPIVTMCNTVTFMLDWNKQMLRSKCEIITGIKECGTMTAVELSQALRSSDRVVIMENLLRTFTIPEIISNITLSSDDILDSFNVFDVDRQPASFKDPSQTFDVIDFMGGTFKCHAFKWKPGFQDHPYWRIKRAGRTFFNMKFNPTYTKKVKDMFIIYSSHEYRYADADLILINLSHEMSISSFDMINSSLLPAPFESDCIDYASYFGSTINQASCFEYCFGNHTMKVFGFKTNTMGMRLDKIDNMTGSIKFLERAENRNTTNSIIDKCDHECRKQECHQIIYIPRIKSSGSMNSNKSTHLSYLPASPVVMLVNSPKISFESFATDLSSTFGFWLGLSVLSVIQSLWKLLIGKLIPAGSNCRKCHGKQRARRLHHLFRRTTPHP